MSPDKYLQNWPEGETRNTKQVAAALSLSTRKAYCVLCQAEAAGTISKYGYRVRPGEWESPEHSTLRPSSLYWQKN